MPVAPDEPVPNFGPVGESDFRNQLQRLRKTRQLSFVFQQRDGFLVFACYFLRPLFKR